MYASQHFIDSVKANSENLKKLIATDLFTIREPFERTDGSKPKDWNHIKIDLIARTKADMVVHFTYHGEPYRWTVKRGIL